MSEPTPLTATNAARAMTLLVMASRVDPNLRSAVADVESHVAELQREIEGYRQALEGLLPLTDEFEYTLYGNFMGGDPRDFVPDEEVCTPEEITAWAAACEEWNRGEGVDRGPGCQALGDGSAVTGTGFGMGTTTRKCAEREKARRVLAGKEANGGDAATIR